MSVRDPRIVVVAAGILTLAAMVVASPTDTEETRLLAEGKQLMQAGNWFEAADLFEQLAGRFPQSPNLEQFVFLRAKANYYLQRWGEATTGFEFFLSRFPNSPACGQAQLFLGNVRYRRNNVTEAVSHYLEAYRLARDRQLEQLARESIVAAFTNASPVVIGIGDFGALSQAKLCALAEELAPVLRDKGQTETSQRLLTACGAGGSDTAAPDVEGARPGLEIAMVLPLSGELGVFAQDIYDGAAVAVTIDNDDAAQAVHLIPYDTKGDAVAAARIVSEITDETALAIVGPLTSEEAAVASARLSCTPVPLLIPAATQAGLTRLSESSFQLSPNIELQAVRVADYAVERLQADSAAVITSNTADHMHMAQAFVDRFRALGGTVVAVEFYRARDRDFGQYLRDIKTLILGLVKDSIFYINERGDTLDPDGLPAHVDCLYLPGAPEQVRLLLEQVNFYNVKGQLLGSDTWSDESILKLGEAVTRGAVFPSPFLTLGKSGEYERFAKAYDARYGRPPNRLAALGYDAVRLIAAARENGARSYEDINDWLRTVSGYEGASGTITFGAHRENVTMPLFRIVSEQAVPLSLADSSLTE